MKALLLKKGHLALEENYPKPSINSKEALVKVIKTGICNTDLELVEGYMSFEGIPGHEFVGIVEEAKDKNLVGKRVVGEINCPCYKCSFCFSGLHKHCPNRSVLGILNHDGAFAEYLKLPIENLHILPDSISDTVAVFVEPLAAAFEILEQVQINPSDRVLVLGDGKLGLLTAQVLANTGCEVTLIGHHPQRSSFLHKKGIKIFSEFEIPDEAKRSYPIVIEATGNSEGLLSALEWLKPTGTLVLKSTYVKASDGFKNNLEKFLADLVVNEITLLGSRCGPFPPALKALEYRSVNVEPLISAEFSLNEAYQAFQFAKKPGVCKVILNIP